MDGLQKNKFIVKNSKIAAKRNKIFVQRHYFQKLERKQIKVNFRKNFFDKTTIGGLRQLFGRHPLKSKLLRTFWFLMWLTTVGYASYLCSQSVMTYLTYDVKTSIHYELVNEMEFPAITICSENMFRKSAVGGSFFAMLALAQFMAKGPDQIGQLAVENNKTCFRSEKSDIAKQFERENLNLFAHLGFSKVMEMAGMGSDKTVVKCWWDKEEISCKNLFLNHVTDLGWCYTFNPSKRYLHEDDIVETDQMSQTNYVNRVISKGGPGGLQLLINTSQEEYCGAARKYFANAGFSVKMHNPDIQPRMNGEKSILLGPGFQYDVVIKPTFMKRNTEHLGRCLNQMNLMLYSESGAYFKEACVWDGYMIMIWNQCQCYHIAFENGKEQLSRALNVPMKNLTACAGIKLNCLQHIDELILNSSPEAIFSSCKQACNEIKYDHQISSCKFPSRLYLDNLLKEYSMSEESLKNNLILVNFHVDSLTLEIVEENQKITALDMFRYFGGILSLFLGVSVICLGEISYFILHYIHISSHLITDRIFKRKRVNNILTIRHYKYKDKSHSNSIDVTMF